MRFDWECLRWGILISMISWLWWTWIEIFWNCKKCWIEPGVLVISLTRKNAQKAKMYIALNKIRKRLDEIVCCKALTSWVKIVGVIGSLASEEGLLFWKPSSIFLTIKCWVISWKPPNWKVKLREDMIVRVEEAANCLRKQWSMNAVKCWRDGGIGLAHNPKWALTKLLYVEKADL